MQHQRWRAFFLLIWGLLFLTSCIPMQTAEVAQAAPEVNASGTPTSDSPVIVPAGDVTIPQRCLVEEYQTFITLSGKFCFAYPPNTYIRQMEKVGKDSIEILLTYAQYPEGDSPPSTETVPQGTTVITIPAEQSPTGAEIVVTVPPPTPEVDSDSANKEQYTSAPLLTIICEFASEDKLEDSLPGEKYRMPFVVGRETAQVIGIEQNGVVDHVLCVKHGDMYCKMEFDASLDTSFGYGYNRKKVKADELLWPVLGSFSFLD